MNPREQDRASRKDLGQRPSRSPWPAGLAAATIAAGLALGCCRGAFAQIPATLNGPPVQVQPYVAEPGVPLITINPGTVNPFTGVDGDGSGTGSSGDGTGDSGGGTAASSTALDTLLAQSWGAAAIANAEQLGINPSALAATCVVESGCQNVAGSGTIAGAFQMSAATYTAMINQALVNDPSLASEITPGLAGQMDPATESIAAAEYLMQGAEALQNAGSRARPCWMCGAITTLDQPMVKRWGWRTITRRCRRSCRVCRPRRSRLMGSPPAKRSDSGGRAFPPRSGMPPGSRY